MLVGEDGGKNMNNTTMVPLLEELFRYDDDPVILLNTSCKIESISKKAAQLLNIDEEIGKPLPMDDLSRSRWHSFLSRVRQENFSFSSFNVKGKDSGYKEIKVFGIFIKKRNLVFLKILNEQSIHNRVQLDGRSFLNDLPYGIILFKEDMINEINSKAIEMLNMDLENISYLTFDSFLTQYFDFGYKKIQFLSELKTFGHATLEIKCLNDDNEMFFTLDCKYFYYLDMVVVSVIDITEKIQLKQKVQELEQLSEIGKMSATITHEIKNVVTSLKGFMELLKFNTTEEGKKYIKIIESEIERMESILSEILYLAKPSKLIKEKISLQELINEVIQVMQPQASLNNVAIQFNVHENCNSMIVGNANRLKQMFINLIKNAIEVMHNGGTINVELKNMYNKIQIYIQDQGIGIPEEHLNKLFTPFFTTKEDGTGLGLSLVKKVVDEHQGKIAVESTIDVGSTFILEFPNYTDYFTRFYYEKNQKMLASRAMNSLPLV